MRRLFMFVSALFMLSFLAAPVIAQDATPVVPAAAPLTGEALGLPEIQITFDGTAFAAPAEMAAGRYLVTITNQSADAYISPGFIQPDATWTEDEVQAKVDLANSSDEEGSVDAFLWLYDIPAAGGMATLPGQTQQFITDLGPGRWFLANQDPEVAVKNVVVNVTGEMPAELPEVNSTATLTAVGTTDGYAFALDGTVTAGQQIIKFVNKTDQLHFVGFFEMSEAINFDQFMEIAMMEEEATPAPDSALAGVEYLGDGPSTGVISAGVTMWLVVDAPAGHWNAVCWMPDVRFSADYAPHAMEGMFLSVDVA